MVEDVYAMMARLEQLNLRVGPMATPATLPARPPDPPRPENKVKLPKLTLQPFKGELTSWTYFWDSYQAAIDVVHLYPILTSLTIYAHCSKALRSRPLPD